MIVIPVAMREAFDRVSLLTKEDWLFLSTHFEEKPIRKRDLILAAGQPEEHVYFVFKGLVRMFVEREGRDICLDFAFENQVFCSFISYFTEKPSEVSLQALTPTLLFRIHRNAIQEWIDQSRTGERFVRLLTEQFYLNKLRKEMKMLTMNAEKNYEQILTEDPNIVRHIPIKDLASYLGIHPDSLSRIRRKVTTF